MRLDMKRDIEKAKRKGFALRTILITIWLSICFVAAYFFVDWLIEEKIISYRFFYTKLFVPRTVDEIFIHLGLAVLIVLIMQFFLLIGYGLLSPIGRLRPGKPSAYSRDPDPQSSKFDYH